MQQGIGLNSSNSRKKEIIIGAAIAVLLISLGILKAFLEPARPVQAAPPIRELVTTGSEHVSAITRARERVEIWGKEDIFHDAVSRRIERTSGLREALWGR